MFEAFLLTVYVIGGCYVFRGAITKGLDGPYGNYNWIPPMATVWICLTIAIIWPIFLPIAIIKVLIDLATGRIKVDGK